MPNHVHAILHLNESNSLNKIVSNGKRFMAYKIIKRLKSQNNNEILLKLSSACTDYEIKKGQLHKVFEPSFDAKPILTVQFLHQKLDFTHHNPTIRKCNLAENFIEYGHSSASFYENNVPIRKRF